MSSYSGPGLALMILAAPLAVAGPVVLDLQTLNGLSVDKIFQEDTKSCKSTLASYVRGGNGATGRALDQSNKDQCGLGSSDSKAPPAFAINSKDHVYLQSNTVPTVVDFHTRQKTVVVFNALIKNPAPEGALGRTVWGNDNEDTSNFPQGWTMATLNTIWKKGFVEPEFCENSPNSDDYSAQYTFPKKGFRYIALYADASVSIFNTPDHTTWNSENDDHPSVNGWQSHEEESDAVVAPLCLDPVKANAGEDKTGALGKKVCFKALMRTPSENARVMSIGWDTDDNGTIDVTNDEVCIRCDGKKSGKLRLYVTDQCGCVDTDAVNFNCKNKVSASSDNASTSEESNDDSEEERERYLGRDDRDAEEANEENHEDSDRRPTGGTRPRNFAESEEGMGDNGQQGFNGSQNNMNGNDMQNGGQSNQNSLGNNWNNSNNWGSNFNNNSNIRSSTSLSSDHTRPIMSTFRPSACATHGEATGVLWLLPFVLILLRRIFGSNLTI